MQMGEINLNATECLASTGEVGSTVIYNICSGAKSVIPWGSADWALAIGVSSFFGVMVLFFVIMGVRLALD